MTRELWIEALAQLGGTVGLLILFAGALWKAFQALSSKWLDTRFAEKLKRIEQQHDVIVRHLQSSIDREFERAVKLHTKEFDVLSEGWAILHEAFWRVREATARGYEIHVLDQMSAGQLADFIDNLDFPNWRKQELRDMADDVERQRYYLRAYREKQYKNCFQRRTDLVMFIDRKGIFMQAEIKENFQSLYKLIDDALLEFKLRIRDLDMPFNPYDEFVRSDALRDGMAVYQDLEKMIHARLWSSTTVQ